MITCLDMNAMAQFLTILGPDIVTLTLDTITIHAETGDVWWDWKDDIQQFCLGV